MLSIVLGFAARLLPQAALGAITRFWNPASGAALLVAAAVFAGIVGLWWLRHDAASGAAGRRDLAWQTQLQRQRENQLAEHQKIRNRARAAASAERQALEAERDSAIARAATLEQALAERAKQDGDPVIYPRALARELRK